MPWITKQLSPVIPQPIEAMVAVNMVALWMFYVVTGLTCFYLGIGLFPTLAGLLGVQTFWHLYNYMNPWTPDPIQFLCAAVMILALVKRNLWMYIIALSVGMLNKGAIIFLAPAWFITKDYMKASLATIAAVALYVLPRYSTFDVYSERAGELSHAVMSHIIYHPQHTLATILFAWGLIWVISAMGAVKNKEMFFIWWLMFIGALVSCLGAADHGRMMESMVPIMFISVALFFHTEVTR